MQIEPTVVPGPEKDADLLVVLAFEDEIPKAQDSARAIPGPEATRDLVVRAIAEQRFKGKMGQTLAIPTEGHFPIRRLLLVGAGVRTGLVAADLRHAAASAARAAQNLGARRVVVAGEAQASDEERLARIEALAEGFILGAYRFDKYQSPEKRGPNPPDIVSLAVPPELVARAATFIDRGVRIAAAISAARDLVNEPAGYLTPSRLAEIVAAKARPLGIETTVLDRSECEKRGMGMFLAVSRGSSQEPRFIHLAWRPVNPRKRIVLVGKGVTFDSGGLSLKTNEGMQDMKSDMAGAAAVLCATLAIAQEKVPVEVHALAACTENMPSGTAYKLGDVLRSSSGKTVEINNTDAEGRLTLGDALTYGLALQPDVILDFATLTGACVVALGPHTAGVMTNDELVRTGWLEAARTAGEDMWPLPLPPRLAEQLKSDIADMRNTGERWGGALTAGLFLKEFVGTTPWVHVDIAGPATASKEWGAFSKGGTGFAVAAIVNYVRRLSAPGATTGVTQSERKD